MDDPLSTPSASGYEGHGQDSSPPYLTPERILEFQRLIEKCYGVSLGYEEASERASKLITLYRAVLGPIPETSSASEAP
jgi:hypothetical protein